VNYPKKTNRNGEFVYDEVIKTTPGEKNRKCYEPNEAFIFDFFINNG